MMKIPEVPREPIATSGDDAWRAVLARDQRFDDQFVYAVSSTRVFCRASCPSRRPQRQNVRFYRSVADATRAGYRACKRCRPDAGEAPSQTVSSLVARAQAVIESHIDTRIALKALAEEVGTTASRLQRLFTRAVGVSPKGYGDAIRAKRFRARLRAGDTVSRATYEAGYGSSSRVYEKDVAILGMTPAAFRRGGYGMRIRFAISDSVLGNVLVGLTDRGICTVSLGDDPRTLEAELRAGFHAADIQPASDSDHDRIRAVLAGIAGHSTDAVPLDVAGTAFQWQVWKELRKIPRGRTRSYSGVAERIGRPSAVRAVARACATNPVALVIPCQRVVREDGTLGGYRWGLDRKKQLLEREKTKGIG